MATNYDYSVVHGLNRYLWDRLKAAGTMVENKYPFVKGSNTKRYVPIIPTQELPEFLSMVDASDKIGDVPFIVYNWTTEDSNVQWWMKRDQCVYLINSSDESELRRIVNHMRQLFEKYDESAQTVDKFIKSNSLLLPLHRFNYKSIKVNTSGGPLPMDSEGGRQQALVTVSVLYTDKMDG